MYTHYVDTTVWLNEIGYIPFMDTQLSPLTPISKVLECSETLNTWNVLKLWVFFYNIFVKNFTIFLENIFSLRISWNLLWRLFLFFYRYIYLSKTFFSVTTDYINCYNGQLRSDQFIVLNYSASLKMVIKTYFHFFRYSYRF